MRCSKIGDKIKQWFLHEGKTVLLSPILVLYVSSTKEGCGQISEFQGRYDSLRT